MADHLKKYRTKAKQLMKAHKGLSYTDAMKKAGLFYRKSTSGTTKKKTTRTAPTKKTHKKKSAVGTNKSKVKKVAIKIKRGRVSIGAISIRHITDAQAKKDQLTGALQHFMNALKIKASAGEKNAIRAQIRKTKSAITATTKHINALKKSI